MYLCSYVKYERAVNHNIFGFVIRNLCFDAVKKNCVKTQTPGMLTKKSQERKGFLGFSNLIFRQQSMRGVIICTLTASKFQSNYEGGCLKQCYGSGPFFSDPDQDSDPRIRFFRYGYGSG